MAKKSEKMAVGKKIAKVTKATKTAKEPKELKEIKESKNKKKVVIDKTEKKTPLAKPLLPVKVPRKRKVTAKTKPTFFEPTIEEKVEEAKYSVPVPEQDFPASPVMRKFMEEKPFELPLGYGDNRIVAMVRDPHWLYVYWEVNEKRRNEIRQEVGASVFSYSRECLRVHDTENWDFFDIEITGGAKTWYIRIPIPNRTYCVDIGFMTPDGRFIVAARSNWVTTPIDRMSDVVDEQWMVPDWETVYALSGGLGIGRGSEEIRELMRLRLQEESSSGWVFSLSSPMGQIPAKERPFWLIANCELIVYGATEPTATLTVQGRKINLREDGTFSLRYSLPDSRQVIPIEAIRDDGLERRKITPIVERRTE